MSRHCAAFCVELPALRRHSTAKFDLSSSLDRLPFLQCRRCNPIVVADKPVPACCRLIKTRPIAGKRANIGFICQSLFATLANVVSAPSHVVDFRSQCKNNEIARKSWIYETGVAIGPRFKYKRPLRRDSVSLKVNFAHGLLSPETLKIVCHGK